MTASALSQTAYQRIREMVQDARICAGMKISETRLAQQLGMSRTPVREAIRQLQNEGVLYQVPQSGTYVSQPGRREIAEIYEVRLALETLAITKAVPRLTHEHLARLAQAYGTMHEVFARFQASGKAVLQGTELRRFLAADREFHLIIFEAADNQTAVKIYSDVQMRNRAFGDQSHRRDDRHLTSVMHCHAEILRALQRGDVEAARQRMAEHIDVSLRDALDTFDRLPGDQS